MHGFSPNELNSLFAGVSVCSLEESVDVDNILENASQDGFKFKPVTSNDVILAIPYFSSQARHEDKIPQSVIVKALAFIGNFLVKDHQCLLGTGSFSRCLEESSVDCLKNSIDTVISS